jgi:hypothetical protein
MKIRREGRNGLPFERGELTINVHTVIYHHLGQPNIVYLGAKFWDLLNKL